jgi:uncharacterized membrane protein
MSDPVSTPAASATSRWLKVALVLSLALNLLVAGVILGAVLRHDRDGGRMDRRAEATRDFVRSPFLGALEPADRRAVGRDLMRAEGSIRENRADLRARFERLLAAIRTEPFDRAAVESILAEQRAAGARRLEIAEAAVLDRLAAMTPAARAAYADRLDRSLRRGN